MCRFCLWNRNTQFIFVINHTAVSLKKIYFFLNKIDILHELCMLSVLFQFQRKGLYDLDINTICAQMLKFATAWADLCWTADLRVRMASSFSASSSAKLKFQACHCIRYRRYIRCLPANVLFSLFLCVKCHSMIHYRPRNHCSVI